MTKCSPCGLLFAGTSPFDRHRVGSHWPDCERRCLDTAEMLATGMELNEKGEWAITPSAAQTAWFEQQKAAIPA